MMLATLLLALCANPADNAGGPVILDFTASWCGPCQQMKPIVAQLQKSGYPIKAVDYDTSPLVRRYKVKAVPTFVVVDSDGRELNRTSGYQPASEIAAMYREAKAMVEPEDAVREAVDREVEAEDTPAPSGKRPRPWETVVRIRIDDHPTHPSSIEYGSGTVIYSTPDEAIVLTCAHIFRVKGRQQYHPSKFPLKITVELSDGQLRSLSRPDAKGASRAGVHMLTTEPLQGEAIDYSFAGDVGLIRIRPGRRLPFTPVVPADWRPERGLKMTTVGCSEGHDATAWSTEITNPLMRGVSGYPNYEAIECLHAPKQGRSGGGLYTEDGFLAGVCDFAEPTGGHGLYATPRTIHQLLDRNQLTVCYAPDTNRSRGTMLAKNRAPSRANRSNVADTLRAQGPDDPRPSKRLTIPSPDDLHVPRLDEPEDAEVADSSIRRNKKPSGSNVRVASNVDHLSLEKPEPTDMITSPEVGRDRTSDIGEAPSEKTLPTGPAAKPRTGSPWKQSKK